MLVRGVLCGRVHTTRTMATNARANTVLRLIHFDIYPDEKGDRPFRIVGARDVEVQDWEYPTRIEAKQRQGLASLWVDKLDQVETYLQQEKLTYTSDSIVKGPEGHDVMVI
ncbi:hypothetical protein PsorP6_016206 [Peronosclerospora sorghi]|uniref:Uncharacterized protein n=1 Tax=Peronosclerospora sorghi TaxID=230839 RepID=A0ACC0VLY7_9STRA|nr:hypothetical protein PsorP6_016206 [Peronosclerospora sorghi]